MRNQLMLLIEQSGGTFTPTIPVKAETKTRRCTLFVHGSQVPVHEPKARRSKWKKAKE
jgi:hypothetical protein